MSGDLISRQDAIEAALTFLVEYCGAAFDEDMQKMLCERLDALSSAEPERIIKIGRRSGKTLESAIDYLQSIGWLQEHDRILTESAEPELKWISVRDKLPKEEKKSYWICTDTECQCKCRWTNNIYGIGESNNWGWSIFDIPQYTKVIAWMPLPEPYRGE